ncbi:unnamed protein product [Mortierella alpina]
MTLSEWSLNSGPSSTSSSRRSQKLQDRLAQCPVFRKTIWHHWTRSWSRSTDGSIGSLWTSKSICEIDGFYVGFKGVFDRRRLTGRPFVFSVSSPAMLPVCALGAIEMLEMKQEENFLKQLQENSAVSRAARQSVSQWIDMSLEAGSSIRHIRFLNRLWCLQACSLRTRKRRCCRKG